MTTEITIRTAFSTFEIIVTPELDEAAIRAIVGGADAFASINDTAIANCARSAAQNQGWIISNEVVLTKESDIVAHLTNMARQSIQDHIDEYVEELMAQIAEARAQQGREARDKWFAAARAKSRAAVAAGEPAGYGEVDNESAEPALAFDASGRVRWHSVAKDGQRELLVPEPRISATDIRAFILASTEVEAGYDIGVMPDEDAWHYSVINAALADWATTALAPSDDLGESPFTGAAEQSTATLVAALTAADTVVTVSPRDNEREIGDLGIRCQVRGNDVHVYGWITDDNEHDDFEVDVATVEVPGLEDTDEDEDFSFILTAQQIERALRTYRETYL